MKKVIILLAAILMILSSCKKKSGGTLSLIPSDAFMVIHFDGKAIQSKMSWEEMKKTAVFTKGMQEGKDSFIMNLLKDPTLSGLDYDNSFYYAMENRKGEGMYGIFIAPLKDASKFQSFAEKTTEQKSKEENKLKLISEGKMTLGWNNENMILVYGMQNGFSGKYSFGSEDNNDSKKTINRLFKLSSDSTITTQNKFTGLLNEKGDMHFYFNSEIYAGMVDNPMLSLVNVGTLYKGNVTTGTLNFEEGKISVNAKSYANEELMKIWKMSENRKISKEMVERLNAGEVLGLVSTNFNPDALNELFKKMNMTEMANTFLQREGFTIENVLKALKGDVLISISDFSVKEEANKIKGIGSESMEFKTKIPQMNIMLATTVGNKEAYEKIINFVKAQVSKNLPEGKNIDAGLPSPIGNFQYKIDDKYFVAGNNLDQMNNFISGSKKLTQTLPENIYNGNVAMYFNINGILKAAQSYSSNMSNGMMNTALTESINFWDNMIAYSGEIKNGAYESNFEINIKRKDVNSLKAMVEYIDKIAISATKEVKPMDESAELPPPPPPVK